MIRIERCFLVPSSFTSCVNSHFRIEQTKQPCSWNAQRVNERTNFSSRGSSSATRLKLGHCELGGDGLLKNGNLNQFVLVLRQNYPQPCVFCLEPLSHWHCLRSLFDQPPRQSDTPTQRCCFPFRPSLRWMRRFCNAVAFDQVVKCDQLPLQLWAMEPLAR